MTGGMKDEAMRCGGIHTGLWRIRCNGLQNSRRTLLGFGKEKGDLIVILNVADESSEETAWTDGA